MDLPVPRGSLVQWDPGDLGGRGANPELRDPRGPRGPGARLVTKVRVGRKAQLARRDPEVSRARKALGASRASW